MKIILLLGLFTSSTIIAFSQTKQEKNPNCIIPNLNEIINVHPNTFYDKPFKSHCFSKTDTVASYGLVESVGIGWDILFGGNYLYLFTQKNNWVLNEIAKLKTDKRYSYFKQNDFLQLFIDSSNKKIILFEFNQIDSLYLSHKYQSRIYVWEEFKLTNYGKGKENAAPPPPIMDDSRIPKNYYVNEDEDIYGITEGLITLYKKKLFSYPVFRNAIRPMQDVLGYDKVFYQEENHPAEFPGGRDAWRSYIEGTLQYPYAALQNGTQGLVRVQFIVDKEGNISEVQALNNPGDSLAEEAIRIVKLSPRWQPAVHNGAKTLYRIVQSINFEIDTKISLQDMFMFCGANGKINGEKILPSNGFVFSKKESDNIHDYYLNEDCLLTIKMSYLDSSKTNADILTKQKNLISSLVDEAIKLGFKLHSSETVGGWQTSTYLSNTEKYKDVYLIYEQKEFENNKPVYVFHVFVNSYDYSIHMLGLQSK